MLHIYTAGVFALFAVSAFSQCADTPPNPAGNLEGASFGSAVALSADGTVALVSGPGFGQGDGVVRTFQRQGESWIEGLGIGALFELGDNFGSALALSDDGNTAVITAPREPSITPPALAAGGVYIYERDSGTGDWSQVTRFAPPTIGTELNFGASCDLSADGSVAVIGQTNILGSGFESLPDFAYVYTRNAGAWGAPVQLVPMPAPPASFNYGQSVAISDDGSLIAVAAPLAGNAPGESGRVYIFENQGGMWVQTDMLTRAIPGDPFNTFGAAVEFDGHTLLTHNAFESTSDFTGLSSAPICIYERDAGTYPVQPSHLLFQSPASPPPGRLVVRGDTLLVCTAFGWTESGLTVYERNAGSTSQPWKPRDFYITEDTTPFAATEFGAAAAVASDPSVLIVGEPGWAPQSEFRHGRVVFPNRVYSDSTFDVDPSATNFQFQIDFPGQPSQFVFVQATGHWVITSPDNCDGGDWPVQIQVQDLSMTPTKDQFVLDGPLGMPITVSDLAVSLTSPSDPVGVESTGQTVLRGMVIHVDASVAIGPLPPMSISVDEPQNPQEAFAFGSDFGLPPRFQIPNLNLSFLVDIGLGANNPTIGMSGQLFTTLTEATCLPDTNNDGILSPADFSAWIAAFNASAPECDQNDDGQCTPADFSAWIANYNAGCP